METIINPLKIDKEKADDLLGECKNQSALIHKILNSIDNDDSNEQHVYEMFYVDPDTGKDTTFYVGATKNKKQRESGHKSSLNAARRQDYRAGKRISRIRKGWLKAHGYIVDVLESKNIDWNTRYLASVKPNEKYKLWEFHFILERVMQGHPIQNEKHGNVYLFKDHLGKHFENGIADPSDLVGFLKETVARNDLIIENKNAFKESYTQLADVFELFAGGSDDVCKYLAREHDAKIKHDRLKREHIREVAETRKAAEIVALTERENDMTLMKDLISSITRYDPRREYGLRDQCRLVECGRMDAKEFIECLENILLKVADQFKKDSRDMVERERKYTEIMDSRKKDEATEAKTNLETKKRYEEQLKFGELLGGYVEENRKAAYFDRY